MHDLPFSRARTASNDGARTPVAAALRVAALGMIAISLGAPGLLSGCATRSPRETAAASKPAPESAPALAPAEAADAAPPAAMLEDITTIEGLRKQDTRLGTGEPCPRDAQVTINFVGKLADGTIFDSSERRQRPLEFRVDSPSLIRGLREGIPGMRAGGTRTLYIPARLAYGDTGREPIPPRTDLVFEIELLSWTSAPGPR